jgi:hypothetical protein
MIVRQILPLLALLLVAATAITTISNFQQLAQAHCRSFPIELLYRLSTGQLAEVYGKEFQDIDCYVRQFVNKGITSLTQTARTPSTRTKRKMKRRKKRTVPPKRNSPKSTPWSQSTRPD